MALIKTLTNVSGASLVLNDFMNTILDAGESIDALAFGESTLLNSVSVAQALLSKSLNISDGQRILSGIDGLNMMRGLSSQFTKDGKQIFTASDRPEGYYRHFTGRGDDRSLNTIGIGDPIHLIAPAGGSATCDVKFIDDVYIRDGKIRYLNAGFDSHLSIDVVCPAGAPFPAPLSNGNFDLVEGKFVANTTSTGAYATTTEDVVLFRFINCMHIIGNDNLDDIDSPEPFMLYYPYFLRATIGVDPEITGDLKAAITMGMFRKKTI